MCQSVSDKTQVLTTLYQANRYNQEFYMKQQWRVLHLTMVAYSVLFYLCDKMDGAGLCEFLALSIVITIISVGAHYSLDKSLYKTRRMDNELQKEAALNSIGSLLVKSGLKKNEDPPKRFTNLFWVFLLLEGMALVLLFSSIIFLWKNPIC